MTSALELIQSIFEHSKGTKNIDSAVSVTDSSITEFKELTGLELTKKQVYVYCILINLSIQESSNTFSEVVTHLDANRIDVLEFLTISESLHKLNYVQKANYRNEEQPRLSELRFYVGFPAINALNDNKIYLPALKQLKINSNKDFVLKAKKLFNDRDYSVDTDQSGVQNQLETNLIELFKANRELKIVSAIEKLYENEGFDLDDTSEFKESIEVGGVCTATPIIQYGVILKLLLNAMEGNFKFVYADVLSYVSNESGMYTYDDDYLNYKYHPLQKLNLVNRIREGESKSEMIAFDFDNRLVDYFLGDESKGIIKVACNSILIQPDDIKAKDLFFNEKLEKQLNQIVDILNVEKFDKISDLLVNRFKSNPGICILLEGGPGTGKTEFCYQLSKRTGRELLQIDLSSVRNPYVGESEKSVKEIFNNYRSICKISNVLPLLMIDEFDGFATSRMPARSSADLSNNTVINLILQEMNTLRGCLLATSNFSIDHFDPALRRRFMFNIKFELPDERARVQIWKDKLINIDSSSIQYLAKNYEMLTPSQIDNICKSLMIREVLDEEVTLELIIQCCEEEIGSQKKKSLGFKLSCN